jgi:UDP-3-O-[3-hydroxymyristoyl] glucosamine N-acyltransferase
LPGFRRGAIIRTRLNSGFPSLPTVSQGRKDECNVPITVRQLAELVRGELSGDGDLVIEAARALHEAGPGDLTLAESDRYAAQLHASRASAAVVGPTLAANGLTVIRVADPLVAFVTVVRHLRGKPEPAPHGIDPRACVDPTCRLGPEASVMALARVGAGTVIGARCRIHSGAVVGENCRLGDDVTVYPNAVLYDDTVLGHRVIVHANAVIGADGFGYRLHEGRHVKVPQLGNVEVGDDVEIGAATTIDRGTFGPTRIGAGTKIDNLVQIGHNCRIGRHNLLVSQVGVAGSCVTGDYVVMAGQVGVADHVTVGDRAVIGARSGVPSDIPAGERVLGTPALPEREQKRILITLAKLPEMRRDLQRVKQHLGMNEDRATGRRGDGMKESA